MINTFSTGFLTSAGLLVAIGAQNTFVLQQGIKKEGVFTVATVCLLCDVILMTVGVFGLGQMINDNNFFLVALTMLGIAFLAWYGFNALKSAWTGNRQLIVKKGKEKISVSKIVLTTLAMSLLNPNVWLDTVAIIGSISLSFEESMRVYYLFGALSASFIWFYSISYLSAGLSNYLAKKSIWRAIDLTIGIYMFYMAHKLIDYGISSKIFYF
ncbi:amino acid transporter [Haemophilus haemoglobinophilus]|nr:amino acid transporter [Canicola haemoglobinophilus]MBN6711974.1 amino acid transporter [Canicola haemoglobinophilus]